MVSILNRGASVFAAWDLPSRSLFAMPGKKEASDNTNRYSTTTGLTTLHLNPARRPTGSLSSVFTPLLSALQPRCCIRSERSGIPL